VDLARGLIDLGQVLPAARSARWCRSRRGYGVGIRVAPVTGTGIQEIVYANSEPNYDAAGGD
jgi:hypothetical protein